MYNLWWLKLIRGLLALLFGIIVVLSTQGAALVLFIMFAAFAIVDGLFNIVTSFFQRKTEDKWWWVLLIGILSVLVGIAALVWPRATLTILLYLVAARAVIEGVLSAIAAWQMRKEVKGEWLLVVGGIILALFGIWMFFNPFTGALIILLVIGLYAIVMGILFIIDAFRSRKKEKAIAAA